MSKPDEKRAKDRRVNQWITYDFPINRRRENWDQRGSGKVAELVPGAIRPAYGERAPEVERRRVPGTADE